MTSDAPVERTGSRTFWTGDGMRTWKTRARAAFKRELRQVHIQIARLGLRQDRNRVPAPDLAQLEDAREGVDPFGLDAIVQHQTLSTAGRPRSSFASPGVPHSAAPLRASTVRNIRNSSSTSAFEYSDRT